MTIEYTFRYWNGTGGMVRFHMAHCESEREAIRAAAIGMTKPYTTLEVEIAEEIIWRGTNVEALAAATNCWRKSPRISYAARSARFSAGGDRTSVERIA